MSDDYRDTAEKLLDLVGKVLAKCTQEGSEALVEAKRRFARAEMDAWLTDRGVALLGGDLDESPMAYRRLPEVLACHAGSVRVLHVLRPFAVAMAGRDTTYPWKD